MPLERIVPSCLRACAAHGRGSAGLDHASVVVPRYTIYNQYLGLATGNHQYVTKTRRSRSTRRTFRLKLRSKASQCYYRWPFTFQGKDSLVTRVSLTTPITTFIAAVNTPTNTSTLLWSSTSIRVSPRVCRTPLSCGGHCKRLTAASRRRHSRKTTRCLSRT